MATDEGKVGYKRVVTPQRQEVILARDSVSPPGMRQRVGVE